MLGGRRALRTAKTVGNDPWMVPTAPSIIWSPDSKWVAYAESLAVALSRDLCQQCRNRRDQQVTDGLADAVGPPGCNWRISGFWPRLILVYGRGGRHDFLRSHETLVSILPF
jgi:hypothetical protein